MKKIFECANIYINRCNWKDMALLKLCLCAIGVMLGLSVPENKKKCVFATASLIFTITYIPLMFKFTKTALNENKII